MRINALRPNAAVFAAFLFALVCAVFAAPSHAAGKLSPVPGDELKTTYQAGQKYTIRLQYTDPKGDEVTKSKALFVDNAPSGRISVPAARVSGDPASPSGAIIEWDINGFEQGGHSASFEVNSLTETVRYPAGSENYAFLVEAIGSKILLMVIGAAVGLVAVPFLVYTITRSVNRRGDPSHAARVGLLFGILACCALFIYLFLSIFGPLVYAILAIGFIAGLVLLLNRR